MPKVGGVMAADDIEPGFYWLRHLQSDLWEVAEWTLKYGWFHCGSEESWAHLSGYERGPKKPPSHPTSPPKSDR